MLMESPVRPLRRPIISDAELLRRIGVGDLAALGDVFDRYADDVRRFIERLGVARADSDDLTQTVFLELPRLARTYDGRPVRPWLFGIATIAVRRHRRSVRRWIANFAGKVFERRRFEPRTPEDELREQQGDARFRAALDALSDKKRAVLVLVVMEGMSGDEAAQTLGIPTATVWTRLHHARRELRHALEELLP